MRDAAAARGVRRERKPRPTDGAELGYQVVSHIVGAAVDWRRPADQPLLVVARSADSLVPALGRGVIVRLGWDPDADPATELSTRIARDLRTWLESCGPTVTYPWGQISVDPRGQVTATALPVTVERTPSENPDDVLPLHVGNSGLFAPADPAHGA